MTDPYRYLPCALHEALAIPAWFDYERVVSTDDKTGPFCCHYVGPKGDDEDLDEDDIDLCRVIDLAHPAGWDHTVRALAAIRGVVCAESMSYHPGAIMGAWADDWSLMDTPAGRREALCRCICAALNLRVEEVFPC